MISTLLSPLRRLLPTVSACLLLAGAASARPVAAPHKCLLWKAVNGSKVVYLLGSIHLGSKKMYPLPAVMEDAYRRSKNLVVEVDLSKMNTGEAMTFVSANGMYTDGDNLWNHLKEPTAKKVKEFCKKFDMAPETLGMFKPWLASVELEVLPMQKAGMDMNLGIDKYFLDRASQSNSGKTIDQVESAMFQLKLLSSLKDDLADEYLSTSLSESSNVVEEGSKLEKLWIEGNAEAMNAAMPKYSKALTPLMRAIREDRNPHMADVAEKYLKGKGSCLFVVGAAHLIGPEGVINLLQKRGYTVFQMSIGK